MVLLKISKKGGRFLLTSPFFMLKMSPTMTSCSLQCFRVLFLSFLLLSFSAARLHAQSDLGLAGSLEANHQTHFYKDPSKAFLVSFFPGFLIHGYGHFYAEDDIMGTTLLTGEILSLTSIGAGLVIKSDTTTFSGGLLGDPGNANQVGSDMIFGGVLLFAVTWIVDMAHAPTAAEEYNQEFNLQPVASVTNHQMSLALACRF
jgi:hypothetical protein